MEYMFRTHKEPAWGWIGALIEGRRRAVASRRNRPAFTAPVAILGCNPVG